MCIPVAGDYCVPSAFPSLSHLAHKTTPGRWKNSPYLIEKKIRAQGNVPTQRIREGRRFKDELFSGVNLLCVPTTSDPRSPAKTNLHLPSKLASGLSHTEVQKPVFSASLLWHLLLLPTNVLWPGLEIKSNKAFVSSPRLPPSSKD